MSVIFESHDLLCHNRKLILIFEKKKKEVCFSIVHHFTKWVWSSEFSTTWNVMCGSITTSGICRANSLSSCRFPARGQFLKRLSRSTLCDSCHLNRWVPPVVLFWVPASSHRDGRKGYPWLLSWGHPSVHKGIIWWPSDHPRLHKLMPSKWSEDSNI